MPATEGRSRRWRVALVGGAAVAVAAFRWLAPGTPPVEPPRPASSTTASSAVSAPPHQASSVGVAVVPHDEDAPPSQARTTPGVFDLAALAPAPKLTPIDDEPITNERFTPDDLAHPERYFEQALSVPELNRPEERRDVLRFFEGYRLRLQRQLATTAEGARHDELLAVLARYDDAIARLRQRIAATDATPSP